MSNVIDLGAHAQQAADNPQVGIGFINEAGQTNFAPVHDEAPGTDLHYEGRRYVRVSVELYIQLMDMLGYKPVNPNEQAAEAEEPDTQEEQATTDEVEN